MTFAELIINNISSSALSNPFVLFIVSFILIALWGDASMIFLMVMGVNLKFPIWLIITGAYLGAQFGDIIWFLLGKRFLPLLTKHERFGRNYKRLISVISRFAHKSVLLTLTIVKFLYGTRVITVLYLSHKKPKLNLSKFIAYNSIALLAWIAFMGTIGYLVAIGFSFIWHFFKSLELAVSVLIILFIIINFIQKLISKEIEEIPKN